MKNSTQSSVLPKQLWASLKTKTFDLFAKNKDLLVANTPAGEQTSVVVELQGSSTAAKHSSNTVADKGLVDKPDLIAQANMAALNAAQPIDVVGVLPNYAQAPVLNWSIAGTTLLANLAWFISSQNTMGDNDVAAEAAPTPVDLRQLAASEPEVTVELPSSNYQFEQELSLVGVYDQVEPAVAASGVVAVMATDGGGIRLDVVIDQLHIGEFFVDTAHPTPALVPDGLALYPTSSDSLLPHPELAVLPVIL